MKLIGTSMKRKEGNYRIERFKVDKYGEIASVEIGCYLDKGGYESKSAILRALNSTWNRLTSDLKKDTGMGLIFSIDIPENISNSFGYFTFCCQFNLDGISHHLDEVIFEVIEDNIIEVIEQSKLILIDK